MDPQIRPQQPAAMPPPPEQTISTDSFLEQSAIPAEPPPPVLDPPAASVFNTGTEAPKTDEPVFKTESTTTDNRPLSEKEAEFELDWMIGMRNIGQSHLVAAWVGNGDALRYAYSAEQVEVMKKMYMPLIVKYGGKIPEWFKMGMSIAFAESMSLVPIIKMARADKKAIEANNTARKNPAVQQRVANADSAERRNYLIDDKGYYSYDLSNTYIKKEERTEMAVLDEHTAEHLVLKNGINKIMRVFGLDEQQIRNHIKTDHAD